MPDLSLHFRHAGDPGTVDPNRVVEAFIMALTAYATDTIEEIRPTAHGMAIRLYPTAGPLRLWWDGGIRIDANTLEIGPGYHHYVDQVSRAAAGEAGLRDAPSDGRDAVARATERCVARVSEILSGEGPAQIGIDPDTLQLTHTAAVMTPAGPRDEAWLRAIASGGDPVDELSRTLSWWQDDDARSAGFLLRRARAQITAHVPLRPALTETELDRIAAICDDLDAGYAIDPSLDWPLGAWRALIEKLDGLREVPAHLVEVAPNEDAFFRRGTVRVAGPRPAVVTLPASMLGGFRDDGSYWACDGSGEIFLQVGEVERAEATAPPAAALVLDGVSDWSPDAVHGEDRRHEWEHIDGTLVLHGAVVLHKGTRQYVAVTTMQHHGETETTASSQANERSAAEERLAHVFASISSL